MAKEKPKKEKPKKLSKWSLSLRVMVKSFPLIFVLCSLFTAAAIFVDRLFVERFINEHTESVLDILMASATDAIITEDEDVLQVLVAQAISREKRIKKMVVYDEGDQKLAEGSVTNKPKGLVVKTRELAVGGESFGRLVVELDYTEIPQQLKDHDMILAGAVICVFFFLLLLVKLFTKQFFEKPLLAVHERLKLIAETSPLPPVPLEGGIEIRNIESFAAIVSNFKTDLVKAELALGKLKEEKEQLDAALIKIKEEKEQVESALAKITEGSKPVVIESPVATEDAVTTEELGSVQGSGIEPIVEEAVKLEVLGTTAQETESPSQSLTEDPSAEGSSQDKA
jgi:hypothetical protein